MTADATALALLSGTVDPRRRRKFRFWWLAPGKDRWRILLDLRARCPGSVVLPGHSLLPNTPNHCAGEFFFCTRSSRRFPKTYTCAENSACTQKRPNLVHCSSRAVSSPASPSDGGEWILAASCLNDPCNKHGPVSRRVGGRRCASAGRYVVLRDRVRGPSRCS